MYGDPLSSRMSSETLPLSNPIDDLDPALASRFSLGSYKSYFDLTTQDVITRLKSSANPKDRLFFNHIEKADLYGPIWVPSTVTFLSFAFGNLTNWIRRGENFQYNFSSLVYTFCILNIFVFGAPFLLWYLDQTGLPSVLNMITLFGYSVIYILPSSFVCVFFGKVLGFVFVLLFAAAGAYSIMVKMGSHVSLDTLRYTGRNMFQWAAIAYFVAHVLVHLICS
jgi:hypothetical protein